MITLKMASASQHHGMERVWWEYGFYSFRYPGMRMPWSSKKNGANTCGNATASNNFQLPLINSHWKTLPFMLSLHYSERVNRNVLRNGFHLPSYPLPAVHPFACWPAWTPRAPHQWVNAEWTWHCCSELHLGLFSEHPQLCPSCHIAQYITRQCAQQCWRAPQPTARCDAVLRVFLKHPLSWWFSGCVIYTKSLYISLHIVLNKTNCDR